MIPIAARQKETLKAWVRAQPLLRLQIFQRIRVLLQIEECKCVWLHGGWKFLAGANVGPYLAVPRRLFAHPGWTTALGLENVKMGCACSRCQKADLGGVGGTQEEELGVGDQSAALAEDERPRGEPGSFSLSARRGAWARLFSTL